MTEYKETPLSTPVTVTIKSKEMLWLMWHFLNNMPAVINSEYFRYYDLQDSVAKFAAAIHCNNFNSDMWQQVDSYLSANGLQKNVVPTLVPKEQPITVGDYKVQFEDNGVRVGCTFVPDDKILEIAKRRNLI